MSLLFVQQWTSGLIYCNNTRVSKQLLENHGNCAMMLLANGDEKSKGISFTRQSRIASCGRCAASIEKWRMRWFRRRRQGLTRTESLLAAFFPLALLVRDSRACREVDHLVATFWLSYYRHCYRQQDFARNFREDHRRRHRLVWCPIYPVRRLFLL